MTRHQKSAVLQTQIAKLEPLVPIAIGIHGVLMLSLREAQAWQWLAVGLIAFLGVSGLLVRKFVHALEIRAFCVLALGWPLMYSSGGTGSFFLLWYFVLVSVYPLLLGRWQGIAILSAAPILYLALIPVSLEQLPLVVVLSRAFLLVFIGWITWALGGRLRRFMSDLEAAVADLGTLYAASRDLSSSLEPQRVLRELARHLTEALGATSGCIMQVDESAQTLTVIAEYWGKSAPMRERKSDLGRSYLLRDFPSTARAVTEHCIVAAHADDPTLAETERVQFDEYGIQSALLVPLVSSGQVVGEAEIWDSLKARAFTSRELDLVQMLAAQAAGLIVNARLFEESRQRESQLTTLLDITRTLSSSLQLEEVLTIVTHSMTDILQLEHCAISEYHPGTRSVRTLAVYVRDGSSHRGAGVGASYSLSDYPATAQVIESGESLIVRADDPQADPAEAALLRLYERALALIAPLQIGSRTVGIVELYTATERRELTPGEIHLAQTIADQVAVAIENARLFAETKKLSKVVEQTADIVYICDKDGAIEYVNDAFEEVTGFSRQEAIGQTPRLLKSGQHPPEHYRDLWDTILAGKVYRSQLINRKKDGRLYYELKTVTPIKDAQGNITHFVSTGKDITELKQAENAMLRQVKELEAVAEISAALRAAHTLEEMLPLLLDETLRALDAEAGRISIYDSASGLICPLAARGWFAAMDQIPIPPGEGISGFVFSNGEAYRSREFASDPLTRILTAPQFPPGWGGVCVPIRAAQEICGVMFVSVRSPRELLNEEARLLTTVAEIAGNAVHRMRLHEKTMLQAEELTLAYD
ncbi:MAG: GAF domain-containing protein, partial [Chloroflexota bacterium]